MKTNFIAINFVSLLTGTVLLLGEVRSNNIVERPAFSEHGLSIQQDEDYKHFRSEQEKKIDANEKKIADLRSRRNTITSEDRDKYDKQIDEVERRNNELKRRIRENRKDEANDKRESFKREFNHDMDELGTSIKDLFKDNER